MPESFALSVFHRLLAQVEEIETVACRMEAEVGDTSAPILRRSGYVLAVAALDSYFHECGIDLLVAHAKSGQAEASQVANYLKNVSSANVSGAQGESYIRLRISFKTLASPLAIDALLQASKLDSEAVWLSVAFSMNSRPDRIRRLLELIYDRRNQIAHEADWDVARLDFRPMDRANLADCVAHIRALVEAFDIQLS